MKIKSSAALVTLIFLSLTITACGDTDNTGGQGYNFMQGSDQDNDRHVINKGEGSDPRAMSQYGFQRHTRKSVTQEGEIPGYAVYDRSLLAESISEMAAVLRNVNDVGVLVTDQHVLIAYDSSSPDRESTADQVKQTAMSVVPSYYDVYVADDITLIDEIERFEGRSSKNQSHHETLQQTIEQMKEYPQGQSVDVERDQNRSSNMNN